ncbi:MAG: hypothetical protein NW214_13675 [Pseudanabaenaceae cyanobacterium bins.39]|nr:hypothetical protein [Pseudanabaenaceae cyanobacterium bins.39]
MATTKQKLCAPHIPMLHKLISPKLIAKSRQASLAILIATLPTLSLLPTLEAIASPLPPNAIAQIPQDWQTAVQLLRVVDNGGNLSGIGILLDIANKPSTSYANAVYQLYVKKQGEWREVYTNSGARLLSRNAGKQSALIEVIPLSVLRDRISLDDIYNGELKAITSVRYDIRNQVKDAQFVTTSIQNYIQIPTVSTSDIAAGRVVVYSNVSSNTSSNTSINTSNNTSSSTSSIISSNRSNDSELSDRDLGLTMTPTEQTTVQTSQTQTSQTVVQTNTNAQVRPVIVSSKDNDDDYDEDDDYEGSDRKPKPRQSNRDRPDGVEMSQAKPHRGHFSLSIRQNQPKLSQVIARLSLKSKRSKGFLAERFIGDYRFNINQRATFIRGLNPGDRLVVRLFDLQNRLIGYSEVQLLKDFSSINLILPSDPATYGTLRTITGIDSRRVGQIDRNTRIYDYFTQLVTASTIEQTGVKFLTTSQGIPVELFNISGLPPAISQFSYTNAFIKGNNALINQPLKVFTLDMPPSMQSLPGKLASIIPITNNTTTFDVVRQILTYRDLRP